jgi:hypothetical protein
VTRFLLSAVPLEVIHKPTGPFLEEPWARVFGQSTEGRFVPRVRKKTDIRQVLVTRDSLPRLRADLLDVDADRVESVRQFLQQWGMLGLREGLVDPLVSFQAGMGTDDVAWTRWWLHALQRLLYEPEGLAKCWRELANLPGVWPSGTFHLTFMASGGTRIHVQCYGLLDALLMALPIWLEESPPRRCANSRCNEGSPRLISAPRTGQEYCTTTCATAARVRRFKRKARALKRLAVGESVQAVSKRYQLDVKEVRQWKKEARARKRGRRKR